MRFDVISKMKIGYLVDAFGDIEAIGILPHILNK